ncbi:MAG: hypothetical protein ACOY3K_01565 [Candidatus Omnitrophota bacterium]
MKFLAPYLVLMLTGVFSVFSLSESFRLRSRIALSLILAMPVGAGAVSVIHFMAYLVSASKAAALSGLVAIFVLLGLACLFLAQIHRIFKKARAEDVKKQPQQFHEGRRSFSSKLGLWIKTLAIAVAWVLLGLVMVHFVRFYLATILADPYGRWDARYMWIVKAKFFFRDPELWKNMFSPLIGWMHPDYPLLFPGAVAWGWSWTGSEGLIWPHMIGWTFVMSAGTFVIWYLQEATSRRWIALAGGIFFFSVEVIAYWAGELYVDIPFCCLITAATAITVLAFRRAAPGLWILGGMLAGMAAWTKNEGLVFFVWILFGTVVWNWFRKGMRWREKAKNIILELSGAVVPLAAVIAHKVFLAPPGDFWNRKESAGQLFEMLFGDPAKTLTVLEGFWKYLFTNPDLKGVWILFLIAFFYRIFFTDFRSKGGEGFIFLTVIFFWIAYAVAIHVSPLPVFMQIQSALDRLLLHLVGLAILFSFEAVSNPAIRPFEHLIRSKDLHKP